MKIIYSDFFLYGKGFNHGQVSTSRLGLEYKKRTIVIENIKKKSSLRGFEYMEIFPFKKAQVVVDGKNMRK